MRHYFPVFIYIPLCLIFGCLGPRSAPIVPPQIITSTTSDIPKPRLLGVNYLYCIGDADTGAPRYNRDKLRHLENRGDKFFNQPLGIASDISGNIYVADVGHHCIYLLDAEGNIVTIFGKFGWRTGEFDSPTDVAVSFVGDEFLYVVDTGNDRIQACSLTNRIFAVVAGEKSGDATGFSRQTAIQLDAPGGIATDRNGNIYIADTGNHRMLKLNPQGRLLTAKGTYGRTQERFREPSDVAVDSRGNIYVVDAGNHRIQKFDFSGNFIEIWGEHGDQPGQFSEPRYIAIDRWDNICVVDQGNRRIQMFDTHGEFLTQFTHPGFIAPTGIAIDANDKIYVTDISAGDIKVFHSVYR